MLILRLHNLHVFPHTQLHKFPRPGPLPTQPRAYSRYWHFQPVHSRSKAKLCRSETPSQGPLRNCPSVKKSSRHAESDVVQQVRDPVSAQEGLGKPPFCLWWYCIFSSNPRASRTIEKGHLGKIVGRVQWEVPSVVVSFIAWIAGRFMLLRMRKLLGHHVPSRLG